MNNPAAQICTNNLTNASMQYLNPSQQMMLARRMMMQQVQRQRQEQRDKLSQLLPSHHAFIQPQQTLYLHWSLKMMKIQHDSIKYNNNNENE